MITTGLTSSVITTLEVRYGLGPLPPFSPFAIPCVNAVFDLTDATMLDSTQTGSIVTMQDVGVCSFILIVSHYGGMGHRPRWLFWSSFFFGIGSIVFTIPYFCGGDYNPPAIGSEGATCTDPLSQWTGCSASKTPFSSYAVFVVANLFMGLASCPQYSLGSSYLHDNRNVGRKKTTSADDSSISSNGKNGSGYGTGGSVPIGAGAVAEEMGLNEYANDSEENKSSGIYQGFFYASGALGPALGFVFASSSLSQWVILP